MLFKKSEEVIDYAEIEASANFFSYRKTIENVERWHIAPVLGNTLYSALNSAYNLAQTEQSLSSAYRLILHECRRAIGPYLCYYYAPKADVKLGDSGMQRHESGGNKSAFQEQRAEFREAQLDEAERAIEDLWRFLEDNKSSYPDWVSSTAFRDHRSLLIKTGGEFNDYYKSARPYRNYYALRAKMREVESDIEAAITTPVFAAIKAKDQGSQNFSNEEVELLFRLKTAIANLTVANGLDLLNVRIDDNGLTVMDTQRAASDRLSKRTNADDVAISSLLKAAGATGRRWMGKAIEYIKNNPTAFPMYQAPGAVDIGDSGNNNTKGIFGLT